MISERLLQVSLAVMVSLGALLLGMGQQNIWLPMLATLAAMTSLYFTDHLGWFRLPRQAANVIALTAVAVAMIDFNNPETESKLIAIANLLIYLQCVQLYQTKHLRTYWQLAALSFLQVVVASALNLGMEYGFIFVLYNLVAISTLILLFVHRESIPFQSAVVLGTPFAGSGQPAAGSAAVVGSDCSRRELSTGGQGNRSAGPSEDLALAMLNKALVFQTIFLVVGTLACCVVIFFFFPRFHRAGWQATETARLTGFSQQVSLNEIGRLLESPELVMRVQFFHPQTKEAYVVQGDPYFRGSVLTEYQPFRGRWSQPRIEPNQQRFTRLEQPPALGDIVRQRIVLEPQRSSTLFAVSPAYQIGATPRSVWCDPPTHVLIRGELTGDQFTYELDTPAFLDSQQLAATPVFARYPPSPPCTSVYLADDQAQVLKDKTGEILAAAGVSPDDPCACATALEKHLRASGEYRYSLVTTERIASDQDPIVQFVRQIKTGHCEHFASALTLMLRTMGIPARMVLGYKGAEYNSVGRYYHVRQLHTHTWVEAYLERDQLPDSIRLPSNTAIAGVWLRLDPTPAGDETMLAAGVSFRERMGEIRDYLQLLWNDYVLGLDSERQREAIYDPFVRQIKAFFSLEAWSRSYFFRTLTNKGNWFSWRAGVHVLLIGFALIVIYGLLSRLIGVLAETVRQRRQSRQVRRARRVEFYQHLERILARQGIRRPRNQTQREFVRSIVGRRPAPWAVSLLTRITDDFYRVRFGGQRLDRQETAELQQALSQLEHDMPAHAKWDATAT